MKLQNMKRIVPLIIMAFFQIAAFAQRGRGFRPEWDMERNYSHHSIDDDVWSFIFIIGIIVVAFIIAAIKGHNKKNKTKSYKPSKTFKVIGKIGDAYNTVVGGGCLIAMIIAPIAFLIILVKDCGSDSSKKIVEKAEQRKETTIVNTIFSDTDYKQSHIASIDEFSGNDTAFYYKNYVFQNKTGRTLAMYSVEYSVNGTKKIEIIKSISPDSYFDTGLLFIIPFQKPPQSIEAKDHLTKAKRKENYLDYLDNALKMQNK